jgi:hypothetical protein
MRENVLLGPAGKVEHRAVRKEVEASFGEGNTLFALQPFVQLLL